MARDSDGRHPIQPRRHRGAREGRSRRPVTTQHAAVNTAVGYLSASDKRVIVGLGADTVATQVEIRWPSGIVQSFQHVKAGQTLVATEPER